MITLNVQQHFKEDLLIIYYYFTFSVSSSSSLLSLFKLSYTKKQHLSNIYSMLYTLSFCYEMHYIVFLRELFLSLFPKIISAVANVPLVSYNLTKRVPET